jgi:hypothetical protein
MRLAACLLCLIPSLAAAQEAEGPLSEVPETVYGTPPILTPGSGQNDGGINLNASVRYATDYMFRGFEPVEADSSEDSINFGIDTTLTFDLGRLPDPFVRVITNTAEGDSVSKFQVIRPIVGFQWDTDAFGLTLGHQSFTYPDRDVLDTAEIFIDLAINDDALFGGEGVNFGPYLFVAYDYDAFEGTYAEAGFRRFEPIDESALGLGYNVHLAYIESLGGLFGGSGRGFQHYQIGVLAGYDLNTLLNISRRYGIWSLQGSFNYTDGLEDDLAAETQLWGTFGVSLRY